MRPTEVLSAEHRVIEKVLDCLEEMAAGVEGGGGLNVGDTSQAIDFLRTFADTCHHGKEERHLFRALVAKGWPGDQGPVGVMLSEHEQGRGLIRRMAAACEPTPGEAAPALRDFVVAARAYVALLRAHIRKEDHILFAMADQALDADEQQELLARFETAEEEEIGPGTHERMLAIARGLRLKYLHEEEAGAGAATAAH
jgi:hemerythrin-like domain-containing protein